MAYCILDVSVEQLEQVSFEDLHRGEKCHTYTIQNTRETLQQTRLPQRVCWNTKNIKLTFLVSCRHSQLHPAILLFSFIFNGYSFLQPFGNKGFN